MDDWEVGHHTASCLAAGIGDQASGRVDVPGGVSQLAAATKRSFIALRSPQLKIHCFRHGNFARSVARHSPISMSSCPASFLASQCPLASLSVTSTSLMKGRAMADAKHLETARVLQRFSDLHVLWVEGRRKKSSGAGLLALPHVQLEKVLAVAEHVFPVSCSSRILGTSPQKLVIRGKLKPLAGLRNAFLRLSPRNGMRRLLCLVLLRLGWCRHAFRAGIGNGDAQAVLKTLRGLGLSEDFAGAGGEKLAASADQEGFFAGKADGSFERAAA